MNIITTGIARKFNTRRLAIVAAIVAAHVAVGYLVYAIGQALVPTGYDSVVDDHFGLICTLAACSLVFALLSYATEALEWLSSQLFFLALGGYALTIVLTGAMLISAFNTVANANHTF